MADKFQPHIKPIIRPIPPCPGGCGGFCSFCLDKYFEEALDAAAATSPTHPILHTPLLLVLVGVGVAATFVFTNILMKT